MSKESPQEINIQLDYLINLIFSPLHYHTNYVIQLRIINSISILEATPLLANACQPRILHRFARKSITKIQYSQNPIKIPIKIFLTTMN